MLKISLANILTFSAIFLASGCDTSRVYSVTSAHHKKAELTTAKVDAIYNAIPGGSYSDIYSTSDEERATISAAHGKGGKSAGVYGEIEDPSIERIIERLKIGPGDKIADLGGGRGRLALYILVAAQADAAVTVELSQKRADIAQKVADALPTSGLLRPHQSFVSIYGDMTQVALPQDLTVVIMDAVLFSPELLGRMAEILFKLPKLRAVAMVHNGFPTDDYFSEVPPQEYMPMTWERHEKGSGGKLLPKLGEGSCYQCNVRFFAPNTI